MNKMKWLTLTLSLLFLTASYAAAQQFKDVTADELKKIIDTKEKVLIVDARGQTDYRQGHIPTAINIPTNKNRVIQQLLPADKDFPLIFYCHGGTSG
jgi:rhodanese-related sulfurtransferase